MTQPRHRPQTTGEEIANAVTHGLGAVAAVAGLVVLVIAAARVGGAVRMVSAVIFGTSLILLYLASTLYHAIPSARAKAVLQVVDHCAIFLLIAGTSTPVALVALEGGLGWGFFAVVWAAAVAGVVMSSVALRRTRAASMVLYVASGWAVLAVIVPVWRALDGLSFGLLVAGGLAYTGGLALYGRHRLRYSHALWHLAVLAGSVLHFSMVWRILAQA